MDRIPANHNHGTEIHQQRYNENNGYDAELINYMMMMLLGTSDKLAGPRENDDLRITS
jgi:hypothetical protein